MCQFVLELKALIADMNGQQYVVDLLAFTFELVVEYLFLNGARFVGLPSLRLFYSASTQLAMQTPILAIV